MRKRNSNITGLLLPSLCWLMMAFCLFASNTAYAQIPWVSDAFTTTKSICDWYNEQKNNTTTQPIPADAKIQQIRCGEDCVRRNPQYKCIQQKLLNAFNGSEIVEQGPDKDVYVKNPKTGKWFIKTSISGKEKWVKVPEDAEGDNGVDEEKLKQWFLDYRPTLRDKNADLVWYNKDALCGPASKNVMLLNCTNPSECFKIDSDEDVINVRYHDVYPGFTNKIVTCIKEILIGLNADKQYDGLFKTCVRTKNCKNCSADPTPACYAERQKCMEDCRATATTDLNKNLTDTGRQTPVPFLKAFQNIHTAAKNIVSVCMTLYLIFFSIRMLLGGVQNLKAEAMVVILSIMFVTYLVMTPNTIQSYALAAISIQEEMIDVTTSSIGDAPDAGQTRICTETRQGLPYSLWQRVDCMMAHIMGAFPFIPDGKEIKQFLHEFANDGIGGHIVRADNVSVKLVNGKITFFNQNNTFTFQDMAEDPYTLGEDTVLVLLIAMAGMLMTPIGPFMIISGAFIPVLMLAAITEAVLTYLTSLIALIFLCMISPLIIPLCLFKSTKQIFEAWLQMVMGFILQPAVLFAYITFMVHVLEIILGSSLYQQYKMLSPNTITENGIEIKDPKYSRQLRPMFDLFVPLQSGKTDKNNVLEKKTTSGITAGYFVPEMKFVDNSEEIREKNQKIAESKALIENLKQSIENISIPTVIATVQTEIDKTELEVSDLSKQITELKAGEEEANKKMMMLFLQSLIIVGLILAITFGFLTNVMNFGAQLTGLYTPVSSGALNIYNEAMRRVSGAMQAQHGKKK